MAINLKIWQVADMKRILFLLWLFLAPCAAFAQSTATPVVTGYLTTSGCPAGQTSCFVQFGPGGASSVTTSPVAATSTPHSGTITAGGTFQVAIASSSTRLGCTIQNPVTATETLFVFFGANGSATTSNSIGLAPGAAVSCTTQTGAVLTDSVDVDAATTGHAYVGFSQ